MLTNTLQNKIAVALCERLHREGASLEEARAILTTALDDLPAVYAKNGPEIGAWEYWSEGAA